jgi:CRP-like cAMP-binding protein
MMDLGFALSKLATFDEGAAKDLQDCLAEKTFEKGDYLLKSGAICNKLYFMKSGLAKTFFSNGDKEFVMRFFPENAAFTVVDSFTTKKPSQFEIMALEKTTVSYLRHSDLEQLSRKHHCIETAFRKLLSVASVNMMKRISEMLEENATERYKHFLEDNGHLLQRISLGDLANYLGITQVSLSRIRAQK